MTQPDDKNGYPELLADLADQVAVKLGAMGVDVEKAADIGWQVAEHIRAHWSGGAQYIPKGTSYDLSQRDLQIYHKFNGINHGALARQYGLTEMRIYQILKTARAAQIRKLQGNLF